MIISKEDECYIIKLLGNNVNLHNEKELEKLITKIIEKITTKEDLNNVIDFHFYQNNNYGTIIKVNHYQIPILPNDDKTVKITIHTNTLFLYKIDYMNIKKSDQKSIYYYKGNFYLEIKDNIKEKNYLNLLELSDVIYEESYDIISAGIKI